MFLVTETSTPSIDYRTLSREMRSTHSAFGKMCSMGATFPPNHGRAGFIDILLSFTSKTSIMLPIQLDESYKSLPAFMTRIEECLGYYEDKSIRSLLETQEQQLRERYEKDLVNERAAQVQLYEKLRQSELEYSSLRSQLQLQENVEQSEVVQALNDLNRMIDDIGRSISAYLADDYVFDAFGSNHSEITALNALDLATLKKLIGHVNDGSSLIASSDGRGLQIEAFFDYTIRDMICRFLVKRIFSPFHPGIGSSMNQALRATYENIQKQVPQAIAGKWRSEAFKNVSDPSRRPLTDEQYIKHNLRKLNDDQIKPLIWCVFRRDILLKGDHYDQLHRLMKMAWDWNSRLKGDVIMLGDFIQTRFSHYSPFDSMSMEEFEANQRNPQPRRILGTLALGLKCQRSTGGGNPVEETVVCKAAVLTSNVYA
ncbi:hypothetical protein B0J17DRAFT_444548 [Rhizoctonia solani]|nr:hypothetical protein B0J17DRAFT_444548 [Rhizoctonia solani]